MQDCAQCELGLSPTVLTPVDFAARAGELRCPLCGSPYDAESVRLIREQSQSLTVAAQCHCCGTGMLLSLPIVPHPCSELDPAEQIYFAHRPPISQPEAARLRHIVRTHTGTLTEL